MRSIPGGNRRKSRILILRIRSMQTGSLETAFRQRPNVSRRTRGRGRRRDHWRLATFQVLARWTTGISPFTVEQRPVLGLRTGTKQGQRNDGHQAEDRRVPAAGRQRQRLCQSLADAFTNDYIHTFSPVAAGSRNVCSADKAMPVGTWGLSKRWILPFEGQANSLQFPVGSFQRSEPPSL